MLGVTMLRAHEKKGRQQEGTIVSENVKQAEYRRISRGVIEFPLQIDRFGPERENMECTKNAQNTLPIRGGCGSLPHAKRCLISTPPLPFGAAPLRLLLSPNRRRSATILPASCLHPAIAPRTVWIAETLK
jgi:hypothetical protein